MDDGTQWLLPIPGTTKFNRFTHGHPWLSRFGHNHRRISRMIRGFCVANKQALTRDLQSAVIAVGQRAGEVTEASLEFWRQAVQ